MSDEHQVPVVKIGHIEKHGNADSLSITEVEGSPVVFRTADFKEGDLAIYVPIESLVPEDREWVKIHCSHLTFKSGKHRLKACRLRGVFSMGMLVPFAALQGAKKLYKLGDDVMKELGIEKYEEPWTPEPNQPKPKSLWKRIKAFVFTKILRLKKKKDGLSDKMTSYGVDHYRKNKHVLLPNEEVVVTEKIHGSCFSACIRKEKLVVSSHHKIRGAEDDSVYWKVARKYDLNTKLQKYPGFVIFGEIYGPRVQDMHYGLKGDELGLRIFDVMDINTKKFLNFDEAVDVCKNMELEMAPLLYRGPYVPEIIEPMSDGKSMLGNPFREGFVIKPILERPHSRLGGRTVLKMVGQTYLLRKNGTEFH